MNMEKGALAIEKRRFPRVELNATVRFRKLASDEADEAVSQFQEAHTQDLSQGGIALVETTQLKQGDLIKLEIDVPGRNQPVKAYSEVMWIRPPGASKDSKIEIAGIQFMGLKPEDETYLSGMINQAVGQDNEESDNAARVKEAEFIKKIGQRFMDK